jgi:hypothetical protein
MAARKICRDFEARWHEHSDTIDLLYGTVLESGQATGI